MGKLKEQLAGIAALIAAIVAIGGGFVKYGEITTKLTEIESREAKDFSSEIAVLEEKVNALENMDMTHTHDTKHTHNTKHSHDTSHKHENTDILINTKEIEILKLDIQELKETSKNPLAN